MVEIREENTGSSYLRWKVLTYVGMGVDIIRVCGCGYASSLLLSLASLR